MEGVKLPLQFNVILGAKGENVHNDYFRWAYIEVEDTSGDTYTIFSECVYDVPGNPAVRNILLLFSERLKKLVTAGGQL